MENYVAAKPSHTRTEQKTEGTIVPGSAQCQSLFPISDIHIAYTGAQFATNPRHSDAIKIALTTLPWQHRKPAQSAINQSCYELVWSGAMVEATGAKQILQSPPYNKVRDRIDDMEWPICRLPLNAGIVQ
jgi:hypothetical protein